MRNTIPRSSGSEALSRTLKKRRELQEELDMSRYEFVHGIDLGITSLARGIVGIKYVHRATKEEADKYEAVIEDLIDFVKNHISGVELLPSREMNSYNEQRWRTNSERK